MQKKINSKETLQIRDFFCLAAVLNVAEQQCHRFGPVE